MMKKLLVAAGNLLGSFLGFVFVCFMAGVWWSIATRAFQLGSF
jgi:hypothetical protein